MKFIKEARLNKNLTQEELANKLNIARSTYTQYENGDRRIPIEIAYEIADILKLSKARVLEELGKRSK